MNYSKGANAKATVGEAKALAEAESIPATLAARFALTVSLLAFVMSAAAIAIAVAR